MSKSSPSRAIVLTGTEQPDVVGRILRAGSLSVEFDNGALRYLRINDIEVLRVLAFLARDENWGTYTPAISNLKIEEDSAGFKIDYHAVCKRSDQEISYDASIVGKADGSLEFRATALPKTDFLTARTGFVVLHPLTGVANHPVEVEHVDGNIEKSSFPALVNPIQPFLNVRSLTHQVMPGLSAQVRLEGDTFEMEDHRNWTDASFKTYVRPLNRPWPYTLPAGEKVEQSITVKFLGSLPKPVKQSGAKPVSVRIGKAGSKCMPPLGLGMPAEEIECAQTHIDLLKRAAPRFLICQFDPRMQHGSTELAGYRRIAEAIGAQVELEVVVASVEGYTIELKTLARQVEATGLKLAAIAVCPVGDLKSVLPGGPRPPAPALEDLYRAAHAAFPGVRLGGGMFSFFTELNRKRPPVKLLDFVTHTTSPIVHAADDRAVMETLEALPYQVQTTRSFIGNTGYRIGPSGIGVRDNPHGASYTPNPNNERVCLAKLEPRQRGLFAAAWTLGYIATLADKDLEALSFGAPTGPLGMIYRKTEQAQPYYDGLDGPSVFPTFHVISGLSRAAGCKLVELDISDAARVQGLAYAVEKGTLIWLANLTAQKQSVSLQGMGKRPAVIGQLDENTFMQATTAPLKFQESRVPLESERIELNPYAVAVIGLGRD